MYFRCAMLPPLLNVRSLLVVWSAVEKRGKKTKGEKKGEERAWVRTAKVHWLQATRTPPFVAGGPGVSTRGKNSERASLVFRPLGAWHWQPNPPAFGPDRQGDLLQQ